MLFRALQVAPSLHSTVLVIIDGPTVHLEKVDLRQQRGIRLAARLTVDRGFIIHR